MGGGTAGLALATRLSQYLPKDCILVIEAGPDGRNDQRIYIPGLRGSTFNTPLDWVFPTIPQTHANGRVVTHPRGRVLGGTSAINLMVWDRASIREFDAWEELGNTGWNWENMYSAMLKVENFQRRNGEAQYGDEGVAYGGPIQTSMLENPPPHMQACIPTLERLGLKKNLESLSGRVLGTMYQPTNNFLGNHTRSYSASYLPLAGENLVLMFNTTVWKVALNKKSSRATGVVILNGTVIKAKKEVILSSGSLMTPKILELSGIGAKGILEKAGIKQLINLPGVGENLQDHLRIQTTYQLYPNITGMDILRYNATRAAIELELYRQGKTSLYQYSGSCYGFLTWDQALNSSDSSKLLQLARSSTDSTNIIDRKKLSLFEQASTASVPQLEIIFGDGYTGHRGYPANGTSGHGKKYATILAGIMHPFARGSVHINSSDPNTKPILDPKYLSTPYDFEALRQAVKFTRKLSLTPPFNGLWTDAYDGDLSIDTDEEWEQYVRNNVWTFFHPLGTCAMLPKKENGVVDHELRVYGLEALRIVDASVVPIIVSGHIQTALYGIAERAAEMVAREWS